MTTAGDSLFEKFCSRRGVRCDRIPESHVQRPDYDVQIVDYRLIAEVKTLEPNSEERSINARRARGEYVAGGGKPGERLRREIRSANSQLRALAKDKGLPTLLVVFNKTGCSLHTRPYSVMTAMQGIDCVEVSVPANRVERPEFGQTRSGPERAMRHNANTSTSGIAIVDDTLPDGCLDVYHNTFATVPLNPDLMRLSGLRQFRLPPAIENSIGAPWLEV
jgi:hypothetical protein